MVANIHSTLDKHTNDDDFYFKNYVMNFQGKEFELKLKSRKAMHEKYIFIFDIYLEIFSWKFLDFK